MSHVTTLIDEVLTGRVLSAADDASFREHLRGCEACRGEYDRKLSVLRAAGGGVAPGELERATARAVRLVKPVSATPVFSWGWLGWSSAALATAVALLITLWPRHPVGSVLVAGKGVTVDGVVATKDLVLLEGAVVVTDKEDAALLIKDDAEKRGVLLRSGTRAVVRSVDQLELTQGRLRVQVKEAHRPLTVKTETLRVVQDTAGVFVIDERPTGTLIAVHQGKVVVRGSGADVELAEGQEVELTSQGLSPARPVAANSLVEDRGDGSVWGAILRFLKQLVDAIGRALSGE